jgi:hypothetical protein
MAGPAAAFVLAVAAFVVSSLALRGIDASV